MKKRLVSIILTVFLVLSMVPFAAFADNAIVCPACGGEVIKSRITWSATIGISTNVTLAANGHI